MNDKSVQNIKDVQKTPLHAAVDKDNRKDPDNIDWAVRKKIFSFLLYVVIFTNFDTGVIPACVTEIEEEMGIGTFGIAALGSLPFFAISLASIIVSSVIKRFKSKPTLIVSLLGNILVCFLFALSYNLPCLYIARFLMGFTQAFWVIYAPVWTNHSSPVKQQSTWLGTLQGFSPLGIILGYICTGIIVENWDVSYSWRLVIILQGICEIPILFFFIFIKNEDIDILESDKSMETQDNEESPDMNMTLDQSHEIIKHYKVLYII